MMLSIRGLYQILAYVYEIQCLQHQILDGCTIHESA